MQLSSCDVTSCNDLTRQVLLQQKGRDRGRWVGVAVSGLRFENALVGSEWATAVLLCTNGLRKQSSCPARRPFPMGKHLSQSSRAVAG